MLGRVAYEVSSGLTAGVNVSYDEAFETRVSADLKVRFGGASTTAMRKEVKQLPVIDYLSSTPRRRNIRVKDDIVNVIQKCFKDPKCRPVLEQLEAGKYENVGVNIIEDCLASAGNCVDILDAFNRKFLVKPMVRFLFPRNERNSRKSY